MASAHLRQEVLDILYKVLKDPLNYGDRNLLNIVNGSKDGLVSVRLVYGMTDILDPYPVEYVEHCIPRDSEQRFRLSIDFSRVGLKENAQYYETNALGFIEEDLDSVDVTIPQEVRPVIYDNGKFYVDEEHTRTHRVPNEQRFEYNRVNIRPIGKLRPVNMRLSCYNCGRSGHHFRDCILPIDYNRIRGQKDRLFTSMEKDSMQPGVLSHRLKEALDMLDVDEPPYYSRIRCYGYPPGYISYSNEPNDTEMPLLKAYDGEYVIHTKDQEKNQQKQPIYSVEYPGLYTHNIPYQSEIENDPKPSTYEYAQVLNQQWNEYYYYQHLYQNQNNCYNSEPPPPPPPPPGFEFYANNPVVPVNNDDQTVDMDISSGDEG
ncbi:hypothetical protein [Parasitella parasitica]|uniref:CCHC-type domain-containing protein n=1 Tax=Parasitella parasitica TaxID=35722 RepID=A0A0B7NTS3_9FUNG|nr:hypothetical protein [Parasitella parasitica]